jgi:hypothetical protein
VNRVFTAVETGRAGVRRGVAMGFARGSSTKSSYDVPKCSYGQGSVRAASGTTLRVLATSKMKEMSDFYGFTEFRGKPQAGREGEGFTRNPESSYRRLRLYITSYSRVSTRHAAPMQHAFRTRAPRLYPRGARDPWIFASTAVAASTRLSLP